MGMGTHSDYLEICRRYSLTLYHGFHYYYLSFDSELIGMIYDPWIMQRKKNSNVDMQGRKCMKEKLQMKSMNMIESQVDFEHEFWCWQDLKE